MNYAKRTNRYLSILAVLALVGTVVQTILLLVYYDASRSLYAKNTPTYLIPALIVFTVLLSATVFFTLPGGKLSFSKKQTFENHDAPDSIDDAPARAVDLGAILLKIGALILFIGAILSGILLFYGDFPVDHAKDLWLGTVNGSSDSAVKMAGNLLRISAYAGILAAVFPAVLLITGKNSPLSALVTVIWLLSLNLSVYFDNGSVLNDPCRSLEILGLSAAILWLLSEIKRTLGTAGRRSYTFLSLSVFGILCVSAIPRLIATAAGTLNFTSRTLIPVSMLGIALMIAARLYGLRDVSPGPAVGEDDEPDVEDEPDEEEDEEELWKAVPATSLAPFAPYPGNSGAIRASDTDPVESSDGDEPSDDHAKDAGETAESKESPFDLPEADGTDDPIPPVGSEEADK